MMTAAQIRQSFLDFFREKQHTIVPSASLLPQSPGLLFTNAGMNQFVPYFLGTDKCPYNPARASDTQKCIRAGGKHNDLEDVGYDTYHHTFFEMLGNWSFGDYFKSEAIEWAWELIVERWGFPANRLYATVYSPNKSKGDPGEFDQESWNVWAKLFRSKNLDPNIHIVNGNVKDNFWMMGDTGPCGPCSELHVDLTPDGDTKGKLVNGSSDQCIEIWNLVFIQYNAEADGTFRNLPSKHVDTGMGFERACSIIQGTKGFTDFSNRPSNYATDVFQPIIQFLSKLTKIPYVDIYPSQESRHATSSQELKNAIAFRVIADHIRTLSFAIADGILPGNAGRNYVLRRILRRAVRYGRQLGFTGQQAFLPLLVPTLIENFGSVFPELISRQSVIEDTLQREETSFNETLDRGLDLFEHEAATGAISGDFAFQLYDTFGFPIDLTQLMAEERHLRVDMAKFEKLMNDQRERARAARKSTIVRALGISSPNTTEFCGYDQDSSSAKVLEIHKSEDLQFIITDKSPFYAEMGGQVGDFGTIQIAGHEYPIEAVQQIGKARAHAISSEIAISEGDEVILTIETSRRRPIEAHHSATHLLHWALHQVVGPDAVQQGSLVDTERLRFDFASGPVSQEQLSQIEQLVNEKIAQAQPVDTREFPYSSVKGNPEIMQFFGDKYGEIVRVVQMGGTPGNLDGFSMELCGGTHVRNTSQIGLFRISSEGAIASGVRRIEASCGDAAWEALRKLGAKMREEFKQIKAKLETANQRLALFGEAPEQNLDYPHLMEALMVGKSDIEQINSTLRSACARIETLKANAIEAEKRLKKIEIANAAKLADASLCEIIASGKSSVLELSGDGQLLQELLNGAKKKAFGEAIVFIVDDGEKLHLGVYCGKDAIDRGLQAGEILRNLAALGNGKGGGRPDQARGAAPDRSALAQIKAAASSAI